MWYQIVSSKAQEANAFLPEISELYLQIAKFIQNINVTAQEVHKKYQNAWSGHIHP